jgi:hypothetical protein
MTEQELRTLVRQAIARHTVTPSQTSAGRVLVDLPTWSADPAHAMFVVPTGADADGPCIIEPAVMCNHCGYCKSMGH